MSGIVGYFRQDGRDVEDDVLADMLFLIERQGPDGQAFWQSGPVALGHSLLKTTHESEQEEQPSTLDNNVWVAADARIDGREELLSKLRHKGAIVGTSISDDTLILHAYRVWGASCLDHLIGDFAFILWDERQQKLFCATDHMGVSPLYFAKVLGGVLVSNNLTAIRAHPEISDSLNEQAIGDYLLFRMNFTADRTSFHDIQKLPAGHSLIVDKSGVRSARYWSVPEPKYQRRSQADYREEFDALFKQAVGDRVRTDSVGTHLSGGMDSTSITAMLAELRNEGAAKSVEAYTQAPPIGRTNLEQHLAEKVAEKLDIPINVFNGKDQVVTANIDNFAELPPEPSFSQRQTPRFEIFSHSARKTSCFFAGYGGDPLLSPKRDYWLNLIRSGQFGTYVTDAMLHLKVHRQPVREMLPGRMRLSESKKSSWPLPRWLNDGFIERNDLRDRYAQYGGEHDTNRDSRLEMGAYPLWRRIFEWHSPAYSGAATKVLFPFFDTRLVEWFQTVPPYPWLLRKHLLRMIMEGRLPEAVLKRPKTALPVNPLSAKVEEGGSPDWAGLIPREGIIANFVDTKRFFEGIEGSHKLTDADTRGIVRVSTLGHWLDVFDRLGSYVTEANSKLENYTRREWNP